MEKQNIISTNSMNNHTKNQRDKPQSFFKKLSSMYF